MSHVTTVAAEIKDLDALRAAAEKFGAELLYGKNTFNMYGRPSPCVHALKLPKSASGYNYEVGLRRKNASNDDVFEFAADFMDSNITKTFGAGLVGLMNEYSAIVAERTLESQGWRVQRETEGNRLYVRAYQ